MDDAIERGYNRGFEVDKPKKKAYPKPSQVFSPPKKSRFNLNGFKV